MILTSSIYTLVYSICILSDINLSHSSVVGTRRARQWRVRSINIGARARKRLGKWSMCRARPCLFCFEEKEKSWWSPETVLTFDCLSNKIYECPKEQKLLDRFFLSLSRDFVTSARTKLTGWIVLSFVRRIVDEIEKMGAFLPSSSLVQLCYRRTGLN